MTTPAESPGLAKATKQLAEREQRLAGAREDALEASDLAEKRRLRLFELIGHLRVLCDAGLLERADADSGAVIEAKRMLARTVR